MKTTKGNFAHPLNLKKEVILYLQWWIKNLFRVSKRSQYLDTDASMHEYEAYFEGMSTGGTWINTEKNWHINALELKPIPLTLTSIVKDHGIHVDLFIDSATVIACISKLCTSYSELCHHITKQIWEWVEPTYYSGPYTTL